MAPPRLSTLSLLPDRPLQFFRAGGFDQLRIETAEDLKCLRELDQTLWVASSCPTRGLDLESATLDFVDTDRDGRIRPPEILAALDWLWEVLLDPATLPEGTDVVKLSQINGDHPAGRRILATIRRVQDNLGVTGSPSINLSQVLDRSGIYAAVRSNGDGVIPPGASGSSALDGLIREIMGTVGGITDRSGEQGVSASSVKTFYQALEDYLSWWVQGRPGDRGLLPSVAEEQSSGAVAVEGECNPLGKALAHAEQTLQVLGSEDEDAAEEVGGPADDEPSLDPLIFPLGERTPAAALALERVLDPVEDFFEQVRLVAFDRGAVAFLNFNDSDLRGMEGRGRGEVEAMLRGVPVARVEPGADLPLRDGVNPVYAEALATLNRDLVAPVLGKEQDHLSHAQWCLLKQTLAPYQNWIAAKAGAEVEGLGVQRISQRLRQVELRQALEALIAVDSAMGEELAALSEVERLLRLHRDFFRLINNYVSFPEFYSRDAHAIFQMGVLIIDGCALRLCVKVADPAQHARIAASSGIYLIYCQAQRIGEPSPLHLCAAVTTRNAGRMVTGKNGVYYDRHGRDWDARIIQVVANPISLREAIWAPFQKLGEVLGNTMEKLTTSRQAAVEANLSSSVTAIDQGVGRPPDPAPPPPAHPQNIGGVLAGGGLAVAAVSSSFAYVAQTLSKINDLYLLYTLVIVLLLIIAPSALLGFIRLRARDLGMILEAGGWAINGRMRIDLALARELTHVGQLPAGAISVPFIYVDPSARRRRIRFWVVFGLIVVLLATFSAWILYG